MILSLLETLVVHDVDLLTHWHSSTVILATEANVGWYRDVYYIRPVLSAATLHSRASQHTTVKV